ncbi:MAG: phage holin family protein [Planctomycetaceae bacterium]|nr:MAG: phage holin family protein [Planctomycetaceae bacterium]
MVQQTKVGDRNGVTPNESQGLAQDVGSFASDVFTLTELQSQLVAADTREFARRASVPTLALLGGLALGLACTPMALATAALGLVHFLEFSHFTAFLIVVVAGATCGLLMCVVGWKLLRQRAAVLQRSRDELIRNLRWVKRVIMKKRSH